MRRPFGAYGATWVDSGAVGRRFLTGTLFYATRLGAVILLLPLLASARGYDGGEIGLLVSASSLPLLVFSLPVIWLSRGGWQRHLLAVAPLVAAAGLLLLVLLPPDRLPLTAAAAFLSGVGAAAFWSLGDPLLAQATPSHRRTHIFALKFFVWISGMAIGGALGGWLPAGFAAAGSAPLAALGTSLLVVAGLDLAQAAIFWTLPLARPLPLPGRAANRDASSPAARTRWPLLIALTVPEIFVATGFGSIKPYLSLFLVQDAGFTTSATGSTLALAAAAGGAGALALPSLILRFGSIRAIAVSRLVGAAAIGLWFVGLGAPLLVALTCLYWATIDATEGPYVAASLERIPVPSRTLFSGIYALLWSFGSASSAFLSGQLQQASGGFGLPFAVGIAGYALSALWIAAVFPRLPPHAEEPAAVDPMGFVDDPTRTPLQSPA